jgi:hypothetical protein
MDDRKTELEERYRSKIEEEVRLRKSIEEKYYQNEDYERKLTQCGDALDEAIQTIAILERRLNRGEHVIAGVFWGLIKKFKNRQLEKRLLKKGFDYFEPVFEAQYYLEHNKDIRSLVGTDEKALLKHFICYGMYEGRIANEDFDIIAYERYNPDVVTLWKFDQRACYLHYITNGKEEGRRAK